MARFIEFPVVGALHLAVDLGWNNHDFPAFSHGLITRLSASHWQEGTRLEARQQAIRSRQIAHLARREVEPDGITSKHRRWREP